MTDRVKGVLASIWMGLIVVLLLTIFIYRDIRALSQDTRARAAAAQQRWSQMRTEDQRREQDLHDDIVGQIKQLTAELRTQRLGIERLNSVTPVEAIRDRAEAKTERVKAKRLAGPEE
jgi:flagellar biosynthesis/type III secretory pathway M-ring protein FliF/YscJ